MICYFFLFIAPKIANTYPMHEVNPTALAMAVATAITILRIVPQILFLFSAMIFLVISELMISD